MKHTTLRKATNTIDIMKTFQLVTLFALIASSMAFAPSQVPQGTFEFVFLVNRMKTPVGVMTPTVGGRSLLSQFKIRISHTSLCILVAKAAAAAVPAAALSAPAFAMDSIVEALPSTSLSLEVQFGAYLAVLLGTFLPCLFLINLFISTETRKAGAEDALKDEF